MRWRRRRSGGTESSAPRARPQHGAGAALIRAISAPGSSRLPSARDTLKRIAGSSARNASRARSSPASTPPGAPPGAFPPGRRRARWHPSSSLPRDPGVSSSAARTTGSSIRQRRNGQAVGRRGASVFMLIMSILSQKARLIAPTYARHEHNLCQASRPFWTAAACCPRWLVPARRGGTGTAWPASPAVPEAMSPVSTRSCCSISRRKFCLCSPRPASFPRPAAIAAG